MQRERSIYVPFNHVLRMLSSGDSCWEILGDASAIRRLMGFLTKWKKVVFFFDARPLKDFSLFYSIF